MKTTSSHLLESIFSVAVFAALALAVATTAYQIFNPEGGVVVWIVGEWQHHPVLLALLCLAGMWVKYWFSRVQGEWLANGMYYGALLLGVMYAVRLLLAG